MDMNRELAIDCLKSCQSSPDKEASHIEADDIICRLLESLGYSDVVDEWRKVSKWYS